MNNQAHEQRNKESRQRFGSRVKRLRIEHGMTQEQFAELLDKAVEHVSFLERGERSPSFEVILDIAEVLDVSPAQLLSLEQAETDRLLLEALPAPTTSILPEPAQETLPILAKRQSDLERFEAAFEGLRQMQRLADEYRVNDILQDNGGKVLQVLILLGLRISPSREGNDALDAEGNEYELKTINRSLRKNAGITTHHHLNKTILNKYRAVKAWYIAIYEGIELKEIYKVLPLQLEELFAIWETKIEKSGPLNNPKIPIRYVRQGELVYSSGEPAVKVSKDS
jgi:transcriptional regulator with XRE-family HTH domain